MSSDDFQDSTQASSVFALTTLTAKPHAFAGAVLSPKHARELTPSLCLAIASALAEQSPQKVSYTLWITECWRVLGWAEPSAALFWEMATMYHTLYLANDYEPTIPPILSCGSTSSMGSSASEKKKTPVASAKELPVWLVGTFLLLHCEELAYRRNLSGQDESRYKYFQLLRGSLSPRTRLHAGCWSDNTHCTAYLLRHLRKFLLLISNHPDAVRACMHLAAIPTVPTKKRHESRQHDEEHGHIGLNVLLTTEELERLHFLLQPPSGGGIDDPVLNMGEFLFQSIYGMSPPPMATIPLGDVEREIRRHLELEIDYEDDDAANALSKLTIKDHGENEEGKQPPSDQKELSYLHLRGTTILLKPTADASTSDSASNEMFGTGRLHDVNIFDCSDAHFYLLQPFEHATVAGCTGCTIVVGAVAGLLHIVDCEKTKVTSAARRILVSNSCDVQLSIFSPSPPLLVGDNRSCQFAPYNTYYDGLREDLIATGLAAAILPENQSPYHGRVIDVDAVWPPLQCASNKWKQPVELSKLEVPQVAQTLPNTSTSLGADDKAMGKSPGNDATMCSPVVMPASEFHILFVPIESDAARQRRLENEDNELEAQPESLYCQALAEVLQLSPFRLPVEYERRVLVKTERMKNIQQAVKKNLTEEQQKQFEEELNRGFRDWLVTSGNLRQVLDLVHLERRGGV